MTRVHVEYPRGAFVADQVTSEAELSVLPPERQAFCRALIAAGVNPTNTPDRVDAVTAEGYLLVTGRIVSITDDDDRLIDSYIVETERHPWPAGTDVDRLIALSEAVAR